MEGHDPLHLVVVLAWSGCIGSLCARVVKARLRTSYLTSTPGFNTRKQSAEIPESYVPVVLTWLFTQTLRRLQFWLEYSLTSFLNDSG